MGPPRPRGWGGGQARRYPGGWLCMAWPSPMEPGLGGVPTGRLRGACVGALCGATSCRHLRGSRPHLAGILDWVADVRDLAVFGSEESALRSGPDTEIA